MPKKKAKKASKARAAKVKRKIASSRIVKKASRKIKTAKRAAGKPSKARAVSKSVKIAVSKPIAGKANLIVTYDPNHAGLAEQELKAVFKKIGKDFSLIKSDVEGLFKLKVSEPKKTVSELAKLCRSEPSFFNVTYHYTPIDYWCKTSIGEMQEVIKKCLAPGIKQNESWKMGLNKRHYEEYPSTELIIKLTGVIDRQNVDLSHPEKIVQVEVIGKETGLALLKPEEMLNVPKLKK